MKQQQGGQAPQKLNIELPENIAEGIYSNLVIVAHSQSEFVMDFIRVTPGSPKSKVQSRIIMTPINTFKLLKTLEDNIKKFEDKHGPLDRGKVDKSKEIGFTME